MDISIFPVPQQTFFFPLSRYQNNEAVQTFFLFCIYFFVGPDLKERIMKRLSLPPINFTLPGLSLFNFFPSLTPSLLSNPFFFQSFFFIQPTHSTFTFLLIMFLLPPFLSSHFTLFLFNLPFCHPFSSPLRRVLRPKTLIKYKSPIHSTVIQGTPPNYV